MNTLALFFKRKTVRLWLEYLLLAVIIMLPMLLPGYILTLDLVFTPHFALPTEVTNTYPLQFFIWVLHFILPGDVIEKLLLIAILVLSGLGMHLLVTSLRVKNIKEEYWSNAAYFAGIFYVVNPFMYSRFMAGQWMVLLGYALLPFFILALLKLYRQPSWKNSLILTAVTLAIAAVSVYHLGMLMIITVGMAVIVCRQWRSDHFKKVLLYVFAAIGICLVGSLYWLAPFLLGEGSIFSAVSSFGDAQFQAFQTTGGSVIGSIGEVIRLQGFWAEARQLFALPQAVVPAWGVVVALLWALVVAGVVRAWRKQKKAVLFGVVCVTSGTILAATPFIEWLAPHLPFIAGYREPHKFTNLVVIGYAILGALGVAYSLEALHQKTHLKMMQAVSKGSLILPFIITPVVLWGFSGQLQPKRYPQQWYEMNEYLKKNAPHDPVLFLPWHQYANYSFSGRIIANPSEKFFDTSIISSDDPEFNGAPPTVPSMERSEFTAALHSKKDIYALLLKYHIRYVLIAKEQNYHDYDYLTRRNLQIVNQNAKLTLYKVGGS